MCDPYEDYIKNNISSTWRASILKLRDKLLSTTTLVRHCWKLLDAAQRETGGRRPEVEGFST